MLASEGITYTHTFMNAFTHIQRITESCRGSVPLSGPLHELEGHLVPTGQRRILLQSGQHCSGTPLPLSTRVCVCVLVWSRLDDGNDDTVIPVGGLFFQGHSTPTPPMDGSEGDAEWARSEILISCDGAVIRYLTAVQHGMAEATALKPPVRRGQRYWLDGLDYYIPT